MPDKPERSWPKRLIIAVLRPIYIILLRPFARPLARRLRGFFLIPVNEQMSALRHDLAELDLKFGSMVSTLQVLEGKAGEAEQGMQRSRQRLETLRESMQQVEKGEQRAHEDMQRLKADVESVRQSMQGLEGSTNDIRRDVKNEISAMGRSIQAVLASLSVASERP
jgi:chromosome segregation ATPase